MFVTTFATVLMHMKIRSGIGFYLCHHVGILVFNVNLMELLLLISW